MRTILTCACLILSASVAVAAPVPAEILRPELPGKEVAAWKDAGWEFGSMEVTKLGIGSPQWQGKTLEFDATPARFGAGAVPAFRIAKWQPGMLAKLPAPSKPFGLQLALSATFNDETLKQLSAFSQLTTLSLVQTSVTDAGLKHLAALPRLASLDLRGTAVTVAGLKELVHLKNLSTLVVESVDDGVLKVLAEIGLLHALVAAETSTGARPVNAESVNLRGTQVTDAGLKHLATLTQLTTLDIAWTRVTAASPSAQRLSS